MNNKLLNLVVTISVLASTTGARLSAQTARPPAAPATGFYAELTEWTKAKMPEKMILAEIDKQSSISLTNRQLLVLRQAGASDAVIQHLYAKNATAATPVQNAEPQRQPRSETPLPSCKPATARKLRVAIQPFDYSTVTTSVQQVFGTTLDVGQGIRSMLTKRITDEGSIIAIETARQKTLDDTLDRNQSSRTRPGTGGRSGRLNGADLMLAGDIVAFSRDDVSSKFGGILRRIPGLPGSLPDVNVRKARMRVKIDYRLINVETGDIIASGEAEGISERTSLEADQWSRGGYSIAAFTARNFAESLVGDAVTQAVDKLNVHLRNEARAARPNNIEVEARVASLQDSEIVINVGSFGGLQACDRLRLSAISDEVRDPVTNELLSFNAKEYGEMVVTEISDKYARGPYRGSRQPKAGDLAVKKSAAVVAGLQ